MSQADNSEPRESFPMSPSGHIDLSAGEPCGKALLLQDGRHLGRRFMAVGFHAIWYVIGDQVAFFGKDGELLRVVRLQQQPHTTHAQRKAA